MRIARALGPGNTPEILIGTPDGWAWARTLLGQPCQRIADLFPQLDTVRERIGMGDLEPAENPDRFLNPLDSSGKIICIGLNYRDHADEMGMTIPDSPTVFSKFPSSLSGPFDDILAHGEQTSALDYEAELAVVIGAPGINIAAGHSEHHVLGYAVGNDVTARDLQETENQWVRAKSFDTFCPIGPWITTSDEVDDPHGLDISTTVNGDIRQSSNTSQMIFGVPELIAFVSRATTLNPGDVVLTGTPPGVASGRPDKPWLKPGDVVRCTVQGLGSIENTVV